MNNTKSNAKNIAEKIIKNEQLFASIGAKVNNDTLELASAYLDLEKKYNNLKLAHDIQSEVMSTYDDTLPYKLQIEITKLKEENEILSKDLKMCREIGVEMQREVNRKLSIENERLNKYVISGYETVHKESLEEITRLIEENLKLEEENKNLKACIDMLTPTVKPVYLNMLSASIHQTNLEAGWWTNLETGEPLERNVGELLCLVHSEVSEALEAYRKDLMDDKLPHRKGFEVELVDALIRIFDIAGKFKLDLDGALQDKLNYNAQRADHKLEARRGQNGKKF